MSLETVMAKTINSNLGLVLNGVVRFDYKTKNTMETKQ